MLAVAFNWSSPSAVPYWVSVGLPHCNRVPWMSISPAPWVLSAQFPSTSMILADDETSVPPTVTVPSTSRVLPLATVRVAPAATSSRPPASTSQVAELVITLLPEAAVKVPLMMLFKEGLPEPGSKAPYTDMVQPSTQ